MRILVIQCSYCGSLPSVIPVRRSRSRSMIGLDPGRSVVSMRRTGVTRAAVPLVDLAGGRVVVELPAEIVVEPRAEPAA